MAMKSTYLLLVTCLAFGACAPEESAQDAKSNSPATQAADKSSSDKVAEDETARKKSLSGLPDFTALVKKQGPAVVNVVATRAAVPVQGLPNDPFFEFFRRFMPQPPNAPAAQGLGSGFIISDDGYILTNAHVIADADNVVVRLADAKREYPAKVVGADRRTDVALLKVEASGLPIVRTGNSAELEVGEWVAAIGSPFGFDNTITAGIVSAKGRSFPSESFVPFIQTDVAVNPGNSGGPLFNLEGEVIGINSMIYSGTGGYMGVSFAIPIEVAMDISKQLRETGKVTRGRLGVHIQELTPELAKSFGAPEGKGVLIAGVENGGPADKAGLQAGDIIETYEGKVIERSEELPRIVASTKPGTKVNVQVRREGELRSLPITIGEFSSEPATVAKPASAPAAESRLGLSVRELSTDERKALGVDFGLLVESVEKPASDSRIRPGDVITAVGNTQLQSMEEFNRAVRELEPGRPLPLLVRRGPASLFIPLTVAQS
jgi:serine protease Do